MFRECGKRKNVKVKSFPQKVNLLNCKIETGENDITSAALKIKLEHVFIRNNLRVRNLPSSPPGYNSST